MRIQCLVGLLGMLMAAAPASAAGDDVLSVWKAPFTPSGLFWRLEITSRADNVTIKGVTANRGNCKLDVYWVPQPMKFGQVLTANARCNPIEIQVTTDRGSFSWSDE